MSDLVERLRDLKSNTQFFSAARILCGEAADRIIALEVENARLREAMIALLPSNLGPIPQNLDDDFVFPVDVTAGEIRSARAALEGDAA